MKKKRGVLNTLYAQTVVPFLLATLVILTVTSYFSYRYIRDLYLQESQKIMQIHFDNFHQRLSYTWAMELDFMEGIASNSLIVNSLIDLHTQQVALQIFMKKLKFPGSTNTTLTITDFEGNAIAGNYANLKNFKTPWLQHVMKGKYYSELSPDGDALYFLRAIPIYYNGFAEGSLIASKKIEYKNQSISMGNDKSLGFLVDTQGDLLLGDSQIYHQNSAVLNKFLKENLKFKETDKYFLSKTFFDDRAFESNWIFVGMMDKSDIKKMLSELNSTFLVALITVFILILLVSLYLSSLIVTPIQKVIHAVNDVTKRKDLEIKIPYAFNNEIGQMVGSINDMLKRLKLLIAEKEEVMEARAKLEEHVRALHERENTLNKQKHELEVMNKSMVGRELRIKELKKRIKELEK